MARQGRGGALSKQAADDRRQMIDLARAGGMSGAAIRRALMLGRDRAEVPQPAAPASIDPAGSAELRRVADVFVAALQRHGYELTIDALRTETRVRWISWPRHVLCWTLRTALEERASFPKIAAFVGLTDHSSALYACYEGAPRAMAEDEDLKAAAYETLRAAGVALPGKPGHVIAAAAAGPAE